MLNLQQGDYVYVRDLSDEQIEALVECFVSAGANDCDEGAYHQDEWPWLLWGDDNDVWCTLDGTKRRQGRRELTVEQVLGTACDHEAQGWDGVGFPPEGAECEAYVLAETKGQGRPMDEWRTGVSEGTAQAANAGFGCLFRDAEGGRHFIGAQTYFRPIRSEEDKAVEEMLALLGKTDGAPARALYRAGLRFPSWA